MLLSNMLASDAPDFPPLLAEAEVRAVQTVAARRGPDHAAAEAGAMEPFRGAEGAVRVWGDVVAFRGSLGSARARAFCPRGARAYYEVEVVRPGSGFAAGFCTTRRAPRDSKRRAAAGTRALPPISSVGDSQGGRDFRSRDLKGLTGRN